MYWFDSCGKKGLLYYNCRDSLFRNQCRNAQCCIGNFFCTAPSLSCKDECAPGSKQCSGSGYQTCNDFNNDGCLEWGSITNCGSDSCDDFGGWACKDSTTKQRSRACYKKGCSDGNCYSNPWIDAQDEVCPSGQRCEGGSCIATCIPQTCSSLGKQCGSWADGCGGTLNCGSCGSGQRCDNGRCVNAVASLSMSLIVTSTENLGGSDIRYNFDMTISESNGVAATIQPTYQRCFQSEGCQTGSTAFGTIPANGAKTRSGWFNTPYHPNRVEYIFSWIDTNTNSGTVSTSYNIP